MGFSSFFVIFMFRDFCFCVICFSCFFVFFLISVFRDFCFFVIFSCFLFFVMFLIFMFRDFLFFRHFFIYPGKRHCSIRRDVDSSECEKEAADDSQSGAEPGWWTLPSLSE